MSDFNKIVIMSEYKSTCLKELHCKKCLPSDGENLLTHSVTISVSRKIMCQA